MTEAGCQTLSMSSGFSSHRARFFVRHNPQNTRVRNEDEDWLLQDTFIVDHSPPAIAPLPMHSQAPDSEQGSTGTSAPSTGSPRQATLLDEDDQIVEIKDATFYRRSLLREVLFIFSFVITGGMAIVVFLTWPRLYMNFRFVKVMQSDEDAERVLVESMDGGLTIVRILWICERGSTRNWMLASKATFFDEVQKSSNAQVYCANCGSYKSNFCESFCICLYRQETNYFLGVWRNFQSFYMSYSFLQVILSAVAYEYTSYVRMA
jgi:hypothetical protein